MELEKLLGKFDQEEQEFLNKIKKDQTKSTHTTESRGGMMGVGTKTDSKYSFLPTIDEVENYLDKRRRSIVNSGR